MDDDALRDLFDGLGPIDIRRLFGGKGIYFNGVIVAIVLRGELMLKADGESAPDFATAGATQWTYQRKGTGTVAVMPYWTVPDSALDDPEEFTGWARKAYEAGKRAKD